MSWITVFSVCVSKHYWYFQLCFSASVRKNKQKNPTTFCRTPTWRSARAVLLSHLGITSDISASFLPSCHFTSDLNWIDLRFNFSKRVVKMAKIYWNFSDRQFLDSFGFRCLLLIHRHVRLLDDKDILRWDPLAHPPLATSCPQRQTWDKTMTGAPQHTNRCQTAHPPAYDQWNLTVYYLCIPCQPLMKGLIVSDRLWSAHRLFWNVNWQEKERAPWRSGMKRRKGDPTLWGD